jgi:poly(glycerol-phosphate) alpha-glucosyltransferase
VYERLLKRVGDVDAFVTLTERQREDLAERRGATSNLFVIPNPVTPAEAPAERPPRDPHRVTMLARLEPQKRIEHAIAAFEQVVAAVPGARLDVFGEGSLREELQGEIERRGLTGSVVLRGFDPRAIEALWESSAMLLTSRFEGYPLSTLESLSRACPVVSYDIKYGPREQLEDGVSGFLVAPGDVDALAARMIELLRSPELVQRIGEAGRVRAVEHGEDDVLERLADVIRRSARVRRRRTVIDDVEVDLGRFEVAAANPVARLVGRPASLQLEGHLTVKGRSRRAGLDTAEVTLAAIDDGTGEVAPLPMTVELEDGRHRLSARVPITQVRGTRLRLRVTWENAAWETSLILPPAP